MTFREFAEWCNDRACDGCWDMVTAIKCIKIMDYIKSAPLWKQKAKWAEIEKEAVEKIVEPIDEKIKVWITQT